jgi:transcriptional regulator with XRE-family HTH domain
MPVGHDTAGPTFVFRHAPAHDCVGLDVRDLSQRLQAFELLDDSVGGFASHVDNVRYSYTQHNRKCTILLNASFSAPCENCTMNDAPFDMYLEWIREALKQPGKTQVGLAAHLGIAHPQITQLLKGKRKLKVNEIPKIAAYLEVEPPGGEVRPSQAKWVQARKVGIVAAGLFREVDEFEQSEHEEITVPVDENFPSARQMTFEVEGDSMNELRPRPILPGDTVVCTAFEDIAHRVVLRDGMVVVVQRSRDAGMMREWSVKQIEIYEDRTEFHPRSSNPKHKPITVTRQFDADDGVSVEVIGVVRMVMNTMPGF